jgi:hypothetical protein
MLKRHLDYLPAGKRHELAFVIDIGREGSPRPCAKVSVDFPSNA